MIFLYRVSSLSLSLNGIVLLPEDLLVTFGFKLSYKPTQTKLKIHAPIESKTCDEIQIQGKAWHLSVLYASNLVLAGF